MRYKLVIKRRVQKRIGRIRRGDWTRVTGAIFKLSEDPTPQIAVNFKAGRGIVFESVAIASSTT